MTNLTRESHAWRPFLLPKRIKCPDSKGFEAVEFGASPTVRSSTLCSLILTNSLRSSPCLHFVKNRKERKGKKTLKYKNIKIDALLQWNMSPLPLSSDVAVHWTITLSGMWLDVDLRMIPKRYVFKDIGVQCSTYVNHSRFNT